MVKKITRWTFILSVAAFTTFYRTVPAAELRGADSLRAAGGEGPGMVIIIATVYTGNGYFEADVGDVDVEMISLYEGDTVTLTFRPESEIYDETTVYVDGAPDQLAGDGTYTFESLAESHTIAVGYARSDTPKFTINASSEGPGVILPAGNPNGSADILVDAGSTVSFRMLPDRLYSVDGFSVDGEDLSAFRVSPHVFENVQEDHAIRYTFHEDWLFRYRYIEDLKLWETGSAVPAGALSPDRIVYRGAFLPPVVPWHPEHIYGLWSYVSGGVAFNPNGDPENMDGYPGSLFAMGHVYDRMVSEITIPEPVISKSRDDLNRAEAIQGFTRVDTYVEGNPEQVVGLHYHPEQRRLYYGGGEGSYGDQYAAKYGEIDAALGHFELQGDITSWVPDVNTPGTWEESGKWYIGDFVSDATGYYICQAPDSWAQTFTGGRTLLTGRGRWGWGTGEGPRLHAIAPWLDGNPPAAEARLSNVTLLLYEEEEDRAVDLVNGCDTHWWRGVQWVEDGGERALVFTARLSYGNIWYNHALFTDHGKSVLRFYDIADIERVALGEMEPYEPQPYANLDITEHLFDFDHEAGFIMGLAHDRENRFLYLVEYGGLNGSEEPIFHVFEILESPAGEDSGYTGGEQPGLPRSYVLSQNFPNPFNPSTTIRYGIPEGENAVDVGISIYTLRGRLIRKFVDEEQESGFYEVHWDGRDGSDRPVPSGIYLYRIHAGGYISSRKMILAK